MKRCLSLILTLALALLFACTPAIPLQASAETSGYYTYTVKNGEATVTKCNTSIGGDITIPATLDGYPVAYIGQTAFSNCSGLTSVTIPDSVTSISDTAFRNCSSLERVTIPNSIIRVGKDAFSGCNNLIYNTYDNAKYLGNSQNPYLVLIDTVSTDIQSCQIYAKTKCIASYAFYGCNNLTSIAISDGVATIGGYAFRGCNSLSYVNLGDSVITIDDAAFADCRKLTRLAIPNSVTNIGDKAFANCDSLERVTIGDGVTNIGDKAFADCSKLTSVIIGSGVTHIGDGAFSYCINLTSVEIPNGVTQIGNSVFAYCDKLANVIIPDSVTSIGDSTFYFCGSLTNVIIPKDVISIGNTAFGWCSRLNSIVLPPSITKIDVYAFSGCSRLTTVYYPGTVEQKSNIAISSFNEPLIDANWIYALPVVCEYWENGKEAAIQFMTFEEALAVATSGTIKLLTEVRTGTVILKPGVTLDLNGCTLTTDLFVAMDGAVVTDGDACSGGGVLEIAKDNLALSKDNGGVVPVWNGVDGYVFTKVTYQQMAKTVGEGAVQYIFLPTLSNADAAALMADGGADNGLKIKVGLEWNNGQCQQFYTYSDDLVKQVFESGGKLVFSLTVTGIAGIEDMTANAMVVTNSGTQATNTSIAIKAG